MINELSNCIYRFSTRGFESHKKYICCDNFSATQEVVKHILECIKILKESPSIDRAGRVLRTRELIITKYPYIVPYQVRDNNISILRVLHTSRKW